MAILDEHENILEAYVQSEAFYKDKDESLTLYDMIDGILTSLGLRGEMLGDKFIIYDRLALLKEEPTPLVVRSDDGVFLSDEHYNALNIELKSKMKLASAELEIPAIEGEGVVEKSYPLYERPLDVAYSLRAKPIKGVSGAYHVEAKPRLKGSEERFIAMCMMPTASKAGFVRYDQRRLGEELGRIEMRSVHYVNYTWAKKDLMPGISCKVVAVYSGFISGDQFGFAANTPFGYEEWMSRGNFDMPSNLFNPRMWSAKEPIVELSLGYYTKNAPLILSAEFLLALDPSLYQKVEHMLHGEIRVHDRRTRDEATRDFDSNNNRDYGFRGAWRQGGFIVSDEMLGGGNTQLRNVLDGLRSAGVYASMSIRNADGEEYVLLGVFERIINTHKGVKIYEGAGRRQVLRWVKPNVRLEDYATEDTPFIAGRNFLIPFGRKDFGLGSWVKAGREYIDLGHSKFQMDAGVFDKYKDYDQSEDEGLYIPPPPIQGEIRLEVYASISLGRAVEHAMEHAGRQRKNGDLRDTEWHIYNYLAGQSGIEYQRTTRCIYAMYRNAFFPSYALLKGVKLSIEDDKQGAKDSDDELKRTAQLDEIAYEVKDIEPLLSSDSIVPNASPILLRGNKGERILGLSRKDPKREEDYRNGRLSYREWCESGGTYKDTSELLASEYFAHYGKRLHVVEGAFKTIYHRNILSYAGHKYFAIEEEQDIARCSTEYRLAKIEDVRFVPRLREGETEEETNPRYTIR